MINAQHGPVSSQTNISPCRDEQLAAQRGDEENTDHLKSGIPDSHLLKQNSVVL